MANASTTQERLKVMLVTGMSGAGITTALKALQDLGYEAVDNVPLSLIGNLVLPSQQTLPEIHLRKPIAIGIDSRNREFGVENFINQLDSLKAHQDLDVKLLFLECSDEELLRRYMETRARHPLAKDRPLADGIKHERRLMGSLLERAELIIDSTVLSVADFKLQMRERFGTEHSSDLFITIMSFGFKHGLPRVADLVFDVRFLKNPYYDPDLRNLTGMDQPVRDYVATDDGFDPFFNNLKNLIAPLLPRYIKEGKSYLTIAVGCTGGHHRSVFTASKLEAWLQSEGQMVQLTHRDIQTS
ncbi:MAG: RNase adapter RapZ [Alphaproteobacteria bacterium]|nr:RNase adapter RapZ [Alphaproteobacteria bacterium]